MLAYFVLGIVLAVQPQPEVAPPKPAAAVELSAADMHAIRQAAADIAVAIQKGDREIFKITTGTAVSLNAMETGQEHIRTHREVQFAFAEARGEAKERHKSEEAALDALHRSVLTAAVTSTDKDHAIVRIEGKEQGGGPFPMARTDRGWLFDADVYSKDVTDSTLRAQVYQTSLMKQMIELYKKKGAESWVPPEELIQGLVCAGRADRTGDAALGKYLKDSCVVRQLSAHFIIAFFYGDLDMAKPLLLSAQEENVPNFFDLMKANVEAEEFMAAQRHKATEYAKESAGRLDELSEKLRYTFVYVDGDKATALALFDLQNKGKVTPDGATRLNWVRTKSGWKLDGAQLIRGDAQRRRAVQDWSDAIRGAIRDAKSGAIAPDTDVLDLAEKRMKK